MEDVVFQFEPYQEQDAAQQLLLQPGPIVEKSARNCLPRMLPIEGCPQYPGVHHIKLFFEGVYQG